LLPATAFWWLDRYQKFRDYLEARYPVIVRNYNTCIISICAAQQPYLTNLRKRQGRFSKVKFALSTLFAPECNRRS